MTADDNVTCPHCDGKRRIYAFINTGEDWRAHRNEYVYCFTCNGAGKVPRTMAQRIERGARLRAARIARGLSLLEAAKRLGVSAEELSAMERGRIATNMDADDANR